MSKELTSRASDYSQWYNDLVIKGGLADYCNQVWVVTCEPAQQLARLMARNGFSEAEACQRINAQPPQAEKVARADVVIDNSGALAAMWEQVDTAWAHLPHAGGQFDYSAGLTLLLNISSPSA